MSYYPHSFAPAPHFILESLEMLLTRLGQLSHHVRDTVARIIGSTVAEAVAEALQRVMRRRPGRETPRWHDAGWPPDVDPYDPFVDDSSLAERADLSRGHAEGPEDWRAPWRTLLSFLTTMGQRVGRWAIARQWRIAAAVVLGVLALSACAGQRLTTE